MAPEAALAAITIHPAQIIGIDDRVGSLTPGKDADIVVMSGHPSTCSAGCGRCSSAGNGSNDRSAGGQGAGAIFFRKY